MVEAAIILSLLLLQQAYISGGFYNANSNQKHKILSASKAWAAWCRNGGICHRAAEMVEYAIVLACIAAIGVAYYKMYYTPGTDVDTFNYTLDRRFLNIKGIASGL